MKFPAFRLALFTLLLAVASHSLARAIPLPPDRQARAQALRQERIAYTQGASYDPYDTSWRDEANVGGKAFTSGDFVKALDHAEAGLKTAPFNINLLMLKSAALAKLDQPEKAAAVEARWQGIVDSILVSGDGKTPQTAFQVIAVDEEYGLLHLIGAQVLSQSLVPDGNSQYDAMKVRFNGSDKEVTLYFNVDIPLAWMNRQLARSAAP